LNVITTKDCLVQVSLRTGEIIRYFQLEHLNRCKIVDCLEDEFEQLFICNDYELFVYKVTRSKVKLISYKRVKNVFKRNSGRRSVNHIRRVVHGQEEAVL
jgi:hypothetical protein